MIKFEMHCHTMPSSHCAKADNQTIIRRYKEAGYGGICVTNHIVRKEYDKYPGETDREKIDFYYSIYENFKEFAKQNGIKVFIGAEIRIGNGEEFMIFGFDKQFLYDYVPAVFTMDQKQLYDIANEKGFFLYQTHPFRDRVKILGDPKYMHGAEIYNAHFHHTNFNEKAIEFCKVNNLIGVCGTDFHNPDQPILTAMYIPDDVNDEKAFVKCLFDRQFQLSCDEKTYKIELEKYLKMKQEKEQCK